MTKAKQRQYMRHAQRRLNERYPALSNRLLDLTKMIKMGKCTVVQRQTGSRSEVLCEIDNHVVRAIWSKSQQCIVTVLPLNTEGEPTT